MTLPEAIDQVDKYSHLIDTKYKEYFITHLVVLPVDVDSDVLGNVVKQILWDEPYLHLVRGFKDFHIIAFLDLENYPDSGFLMYHPLEDIIINN